MRNCKELTKLASRACDEQIGFGEKIELKLHLMMCKRCRQFVQNNQKLHKIMQSYRQVDENK